MFSTSFLASTSLDAGGLVVTTPPLWQSTNLAEVDELGIICDSSGRSFGVDLPTAYSTMNGYTVQVASVMNLLVLFGSVATEWARKHNGVWEYLEYAGKVKAVAAEP